MDKLLGRYTVVIASDVSGDRDGIGIEVFDGEEMIMDIFRDDSKGTREISTFSNDVDLELVEAAIAVFKKEIPWEFQP
jgi:hypothetical protein